jgi:L,D-transpeptidase YcbB
MFDHGNGKGTMALNRRGLLLGMAGLALAIAMPGPVRADKRDEGNTIITNFNRPKSTATTETKIVTDAADAVPMLSTASYQAMQDAIARYETIETLGGWSDISSKREMRKGGKGELVEVLRKRLAIEGYLADTEVTGEKFDDAVQDAVVAFQRSHGLKVTGRVDGQTIAELNVPVAERLSQMRANLPRIELYAQQLFGRYITVNIPATQLEAVNFDGKVYSRHNIIVGKPDRPSPIVAAALSDINFNPYWNAPVSIVERDIIPAMLKDKETLQKMDMKVFDGYGGPEIDPSKIDWANTPADRYFFRQEPGEKNAMATVKINFPSPFGVYMHDTPTKQLFNEALRFESSGCVRVEQVHVLVDWILDKQDGWDMDRIQQVSDKVERADVKVGNPPQLRWVYLTAWALPGGQVHFRPDIYELDGTGFVVGQPTPVGELAADGRRWLYVMPPAPVMGAQATLPASSDDSAIEPSRPN